MVLRVGVPDLISPSYFPAIAAVELGYFEREGIAATIDLVFPVVRTFEHLRDGQLDIVVGAAHAPLYVYSRWQGCKLVAAMSQHMYWFLVVRSDLDARRGDLGALRGLRIGAAPGPVDGLRQMLRAVGMDPDHDLSIGPVPRTEAGDTSFGVMAAEALRRHELDGFWANGMGAEVAVRAGTGKVLLDARRGDGPPGAERYTFAAMVVTDRHIEEAPAEVAAATRAIVAAQLALRDEPELATKAATRLFPAYERTLIAALVERDAPFYDPSISEDSVRSLNRFAADLELLPTSDVPYEDVVARQFRSESSP